MKHFLDMKQLTEYFSGDTGFPAVDLEETWFPFRRIYEWVGQSLSLHIYIYIITIFWGITESVNQD